MWLVLSLMAAVSFGVRGILYHWTSQKPIDRNLMLFGVFSTGAVISAIFSVILDQVWSPGVLIGVLMGTFSFAANGSMYKGFAVGKASLVAILSGLPPVVVVVLAYLMWGEKLTGMQWLAFLIIVAGILLVRYSNDLSLKNLKGAQWGLLTMLFFGLNDLSNKQATLLDAAMFPTLTMMFITGSAFFCAWWLIARRRQAGGKPFVPDGTPLPAEAPWSAIKTYSWGLLVGVTNATGMVFLFQAFKYGITGLVSAVIAMNVAIILLYTRIILKERFSRLEFSGLCLSLAGIVVLRLAG